MVWNLHEATFIQQSSFSPFSTFFALWVLLSFPLSQESAWVKMTERYDCHYCKESLFGKKYVLREENPYCVKCYESLYSNTCEECKKPIGCNSRVSYAANNYTIGPTGFLCEFLYWLIIIIKVLSVCLCAVVQDLSYKDRHWHEECFKCFQCKRSLVDKPFSTKDEQLLCTECYSNEYSSKCHECKKTIMPGIENNKESDIFKLSHRNCSLVAYLNSQYLEICFHKWLR